MKGRLTVLKRDGVVIAGGKSKGISFSGGNADATTADSNGATEIEEGTAIVSTSISFDGNLKNDAAQIAIRADKKQGTISPWTLEYEDESSDSGNFEVSSLDISSPHDGVATFSCSLTASGPVAFTPGS